MQAGLDPPILENELVQWIKAHQHQAFQELEEIEADALAHGLKFQNISYPLFPRLLILSANFRLAAEFLSERLLTILEKVIHIFETDAPTQNFFQLDSNASTLASIPSGYARKIRISRFDTFLDNRNTPRVLENNTDCPAGVIFTGRVMQLTRRTPTLQRFIEKYVQLREDPIEGPDIFVETLSNAFREFQQSNAEPSCICLLQPRHSISQEILEIASLLRSHSFKVFIADPRDLELSAGALRIAGTRIDLVWNKINTVDFDKLDPVNSMKPFLEACRESLVCHVNSFQARYISESKLCLAYLCEPRFRRHFTEEELSIIRTVIPWTRKLEDSEVDYEGRVDSLRRLALQHREQFVLKAAYDIRGNGVTIGRSTPAEAWGKLIDQCWGRPYVLQEYVEAPKLQVPERGSTSWTTMKFSLDMFMLQGRLQGFGSKISTGDKLNLFQGGSKLPVFCASGASREYYVNPEIL